MSERAVVAPPRQQRWVVLLLIVAAIGLVGYAAALFGLHDWIAGALAKAAKTAKKGTKQPTIHQYQIGVLVQYIAVGLVLLVTANMIYKGRYWSRWVVLGVWVVCAITGTASGILGLSLPFATTMPLALRIPGFISAVALLAAMVLANMRPLGPYLSAQRGESTPRPRRSFLGGGPSSVPPPRTRKPAATNPATSKPATTSLVKQPAAVAAAAPRNKAKVRAENEAVARGAELARSRAKAAKTRRPGP